MKNPLADREALYKLWFEFLRLAHETSDADVESALARSYSFYEPWGDVKSMTADEWWQKHWVLFDDMAVQQLKLEDFVPLDEDEIPDFRRPPPPGLLEFWHSDPFVGPLYLKVSLTRSPHEIGRMVAELVSSSMERRKKRKYKSHARYSLTYGAEPKLKALSDRLFVYRHGWLGRPDLTHKARLALVQDAYERIAPGELPGSLRILNGDMTRPLKNIGRMIEDSRRIILNVASGEFPGQYRGDPSTKKQRASR